MYEPDFVARVGRRAYFEDSDFKRGMKVLGKHCEDRMPSGQGNHLMVPKDKVVRIKPDHVLCEVCGCGRGAKFILHRDVGAHAVVAYCEGHVNEVGQAQGMGMLTQRRVTSAVLGLMTGE